MKHNLLISCPKGLEETLKSELIQLNINIQKQTVGGVFIEATLNEVYCCLLYLRTANRILIHLYSERAKTAEDIIKQATAFDWQSHFAVEQSLAIDFSGNNEHIRNTMFGAQCLKDGISDYFRALCGSRPSIAKHTPDIQLKAILRKGSIHVYLDLAGKSLHQRGYRQQQGSAPLKENVASGLLLQAGWINIAKEGGALIDPFCGSGTFLIEAWQLATQYAPGLQLTENFELGWRSHQPELWQKLYEQAKTQHQQAALAFNAPIIGFDSSTKMVAIAKQNIQAAGLEKCIQVSCRNIENLTKPKHLQKGLLICNPPYGERLSEVNQLLVTYQQLGKQVKQHCTNWRLAVLTSEPKLSKAIGLKSYRQYKVKNGALDCQLSLFDITEDNRFNLEAANHLSKEGAALLNRLKKNQQKLKSWRHNQQVDSYRLYNADLVEFNVAIDIYQSVDGKQYAHVQEYLAPKTVDETKALNRLKIVLEVLVHGLKLESENIFVKQRRRQKGSQQYQRQQYDGQRIIAKDGSVVCYVNLSDYLDTGVFLDHRRLRSSFDKLEGKRFLNLFCYTAVASLHAAKQNIQTTNIDLSKTYLNWAKDNFRLNHYTIDKHQFIQADVIPWLEQCNIDYDVIFCDPPSFSNSKRMEGVFDVQRDHQQLISLCMQRLTKGGVLYFSCNLKKFKLDDAIQNKYQVIDLTQKTVSKDFDNAKLNHHTFKVTLR